MTPQSINPIFTEEARGSHRENFHRGSAVIVDTKGHIIHSWGDVDRPIYGRSAVKLMQALPLIESGAADKWSLSEQEITMACASHNGEKIHTEAAEKWLRRLGLTEKTLECGILRPGNHDVARHLTEHKMKPTPLHHACSGKHLGFLTTALFHGEKPAGYVMPQHGVQKRIRKVLEEMTDVSLETLPSGTDGCNIPTYAIPLKNLALGLARFADPSGLPGSRQKAIHRIIQSIQHHPEYLHGTGAFDTRLIQATQGDVISKMGAGGIQVAAVISKGWGVALKIDDGHSKAAELAMVSLLETIGVLEKGLMDDKIPILSHTKQTVGFLKPTDVFKKI